MFKKGGKKSTPNIGTSSDIVFMLLFFFMVTTQMRETENKVVVKLPTASESAKLERKDLSSYIIHPTLDFVQTIPSRVILDLSI